MGTAQFKCIQSSQNPAFFFPPKVQITKVHALVKQCVDLTDTISLPYPAAEPGAIGNKQPFPWQRDLMPLRLRGMGGLSKETSPLSRSSGKQPGWHKKFRGEAAKQTKKKHSDVPAVVRGQTDCVSLPVWCPWYNLVPLGHQSSAQHCLAPQCSLYNILRLNKRTPSKPSSIAEVPPNIFLKLVCLGKDLAKQGDGVPGAAELCYLRFVAMFGTESRYCGSPAWQSALLAPQARPCQCPGWGSLFHHALRLGVTLRQAPGAACTSTSAPLLRWPGPGPEPMSPLHRAGLSSLLFPCAVHLSQRELLLPGRGWAPSCLCCPEWAGKHSPEMPPDRVTPQLVHATTKAIRSPLNMSKTGSWGRESSSDAVRRAREVPCSHTTGAGTKKHPWGQMFGKEAKHMAQLLLGYASQGSSWAKCMEEKMCAPETFTLPKRTAAYPLFTLPLQNQFFFADILLKSVVH